MKKLKRIFSSLLVAASLSVAVLPVSAGAVDVFSDACKNDRNNPICQSTNNSNPGPVVQSVINILLYIAGIAAVIVIIIGGIMYVVSHGDSSKIKTAKDTILYAVVGLVVAILAFAIVNFVLSRL